MKKKTLSLVIPVYNEAERLEKTFTALKEGVGSRELSLTEVIFVNDGSTDETVKLIKGAKKELEKGMKGGVKLVSYKENKGKGYAVRYGMQLAKGDYLLIADADVATPFYELSKMDQHVSKDVEVIVGTRKNGKSTVVVPQPIYRQVLGKGFTIITQVILNTWVSDFTCGFKLLSKSAYRAIGRRMKVDRWGYDGEMIYLARVYSCSITEVSVKWYDDRRSKVRVVRDIGRTMLDLAYVRWNGWMGVYADPVKRVNLEKGRSAWQNKTVYTS